MSQITLLTDPDRFDGRELRVEGDPYKHLFRARRLVVGDRIRVVDGAGRARWSEVVRIDRASAVLALGEPAPGNEPDLRLDLLVPTLRPERASWLVEKATEVGVAAICFLHTERAPRDFGAGTLGRLRRVAAAALEQCQGSRLPALSGPHEWSDLDSLTAGAERWVLDLHSSSLFVGEGLAPSREGGKVLSSSPHPASAREGASPSPTQTTPAGGDVALLVGPEGGWSDRERAELRAAGWRALSLGARVLRAETAAVVGAAALLEVFPVDTRRGSG